LTKTVTYLIDIIIIAVVVVVLVSLLLLRLWCQPRFCFASGANWSEESIDAFERLTYAAQWKKLLARIVRADGKASGDSGVPARPAVDLVDANSSQVSSPLLGF
jgi:hypothetical protein